MLALIEIVAEARIPIYVSDNSSDDETGAVIQALRGRYSLLHYSRSRDNLGPDQNFERALQMADAKYKWLFGDHYHIESCESLRHLLGILEQEDFDLVTLNARDRVTSVSSRVFTDKDEVLAVLGWHLTMLTSLIFSRRFCAALNFSRFEGTFLSQTLALFEQLADKPFRLYWVHQATIGGHPVSSSSSWHPRAFEIFVRDWFYGVMSLPPTYGIEAKRQALVSHAANVWLFSFRGMVYLRSLNAIRPSLVKRHLILLPFVLPKLRIVYLLLSLLVPRPVAALYARRLPWAR